jgi:hypothetical protein
MLQTWALPVLDFRAESSIRQGRIGLSLKYNTLPQYRFFGLQ